MIVLYVSAIAFHAVAIVLYVAAMVAIAMGVE